MKSPEELDIAVRQAQKGDQRGFDALVAEFAPRLYGFLHRMIGRREDAEDLVQEVFVRLVRMIGHYEHDGRFESWLFRIATNLARDRVRRLRRRPILGPLEHDGDGQPYGARPVSGKSDGESVAADRLGESGEAGLRLERALAQLPDGEREVILLRHYGGMSFAEIANLMGTPLGTALARAHRGLGKLRGLMEDPT